MRTKIILVLILMILAVSIISISKSRIVFVKNTADINVYTDKDFKASDNILISIQDSKIKNKIKDINEKYLVMPNNKDSQFCNKENTILISENNGIGIVMSETTEKIEVFKSSKNKCDLIADVDNSGDLLNIDNIVYANDSIYAMFDSKGSLELNGMIRLQGDKTTNMDSVYNRYKNAVSFDEGVLMIENNKNIVAFDDENKKIFEQNNEKNNRNIIALNVIDNNLFVIEKNNEEIKLEGYDLNKEENIVKSKPDIVYPLTDYVKNINFNSNRFNITNNNQYASFTFGNNTIVTNKKMSKLYLLNNIDKVVGFISDVAIVRNMDMYSALNFNNFEQEEIGKVRALSLKLIGNTLYFALLNSENNEVYLKYAIK